MTYNAYFLCDICGHKWETTYTRINALEQGDICENCINRPPYRENFRGCVAEPYFYEKLERDNNEAGRNS